MHWLTVALLGVVIGSNNFAAGLALGVLGQASRTWRVVLTFGAFEFGVPLLGMWLGQTVSDWIERQAGWLGIVLLAGVGAWMIWSALRHTSSDEKLARRATTWGGLTALAAGLSVDNLIIGFSLGLRRLDPLTVAATIAAFSMAFTWVGIRFGDVSRRHWERPSEILAGALLLGVAVLEVFGVL